MNELSRYSSRDASLNMFEGVIMRIEEVQCLFSFLFLARDIFINSYVLICIVY